MKKIVFFLLILPSFIIGQTSNWCNGSNSERAFIENKGQFEGRNWQSSNEIEYAITQNPYYIFFTKKGLTYRLDKMIRTPNRKRKDVATPKRTNISELIHVTWLGSNPNVKIVAEGRMDNYFSYVLKDRISKEITNINHVKGYEKITYKNLYDKIDVEYFFHPDEGVKYSIILHPGADPSQIKMQYTTEHTNVKNENISLKINMDGQIEINSSLANIIEHQPFTFYNDSKVEINSKYVFSNNVLSFDINNYDNSKEIIIDPWMVVATFNSSNAVWEVETDGVGNVYVIGGESPMVLKKYNSTGALQWTYNTPWDTATVWLGTLATDVGGTSYVTSGVSAEMHKVDNAGNFVWQTAPSGGLQYQSEWWSITFNCDETKLIVGGTWVNGILSFDFYGGIFNIDVATGNVLGAQQFTHVNISGFGNFPQEVRSISSSKNAKYIYLTHDSVGAINQDIGLCPTNTPLYQVDNTHHLAYKCENYLPSSQNGGGLKALVANDNYFYTHRGDQIRQWDINTGTLLTTVGLPGGNSSTDIFGDRIVSCSGLDVDAAGNVYAGSMDRVVKFDANLNILSSANTTNGFTVYDVSVNSNGEVVAAGAEGNNVAPGNRVGRIESFNMSSTGQYALVCCDANFCPVAPLCDTDAPVNLSPNTPGGTWSSSPVTAGLNTSTGVFDPATAGVGTYTITYSLSCGTNSTVIQVINCSALIVCVESNGDLTVTGGTGPYTWDEWVPASSTPITNSAQCVSCGGTWNTFPAGCFNPFPIPLNTCNSPAGWSNFGTGVTVTPPVGADTVQVTDGFGNNLIIYNIGTLPPCSGCDATITQAGPFCINTPGGNLTAAQTGGTWSGTGITSPTNGTFDPATAGVGSFVITYNLPCGDVDTITIVVNPLPNSGINGALSLCSTDPSADLFLQLGGSPDLGGTWSPVMTSGTGVFDPAADPAGTYTYSITNSCGTSSNNVVVTITANPSPGTNGTASVCANAQINLFDSLGGTPDPGGTWSPTLTSGTGMFDPGVDPAGTYTYSINDCAGNPQTATVIVTITLAPNTGIDGVLSICPTDPSTDLFLQLGGSPDLGGTWSPVMTSGTGVFDPAADPAGTYTYSITNSCGTSSNNVVVTITANPSPGTNGTVSICSNATTINLFDSLGGSPDLGGIWSPVLTSGTGVFDPGVDPAGTYTYSINDCAGNPQTATVIVTITLAPNTGIDGALSICPTDPSTDLFLQLGGSPDIGGTWSPAMTSGTGVFDPALDPSGTYIYTVTNSCGTSSNNVVVTITANPSPGTGGTLIACSNDSVTDLFSLLGGTPSVGGTWSPILTSGTGVFDPAVDPSGSYTYTIMDCALNPLSSTVIVTVNPAPNSGTDGALTICSTDPSTDLFLQLGGSPDLSGVWSPALTSGTGMFDPAIDPAGTYTYTVTNSCGTSSNNVVVTINSCTLPTASYTSSEDSICEGNCINFTDMSIGATSWLWTFNGASPNSSTNQNPTNICFDTSGTYIIEQIVTNSNGSDTASSSIIVNIAPIINAGNDVIIEIGQSTTLNATGTNGVYTWSPFTWLDCATCVSPISTPDETITYTVIVVDSNGCTASDQVTVIVDFDNVIWVPNIFSPNGDGNNDILFVRGKGVASFNFFLYDRWGEKVFETQNLDSGWNGTFNGKKMNNAVFVYYLQATFIDGSEVTQKGDITLIR